MHVLRYTDEQLDEIQRLTTADPKDNAGVVLPLIWDLQDARKRIAKLESYLEETADGVLVREAEKLYCPKCGQEIPESDQYFDFLQCWNCTNPDNFNESPLPLLYCSCLAKPKDSG